MHEVFLVKGYKNKIARLLLKSQQKMHNNTYYYCSHLQILCDIGNKLVLFSKIISAKMLNLGTADTQYMNNVLESFSIERLKTFETGMFFILDSNRGNIKMFPTVVFNYTV